MKISHFDKENLFRTPLAALVEAGMSGINRAAPAQNVSYDKVLNDVTDKWNGQKVIVKELSVDKLKTYASTSKEVNPMTTPKYKMVKHADGYNTANKKIANKTGDRRAKTYEETLQQFLEDYNLTPHIATQQQPFKRKSSYEVKIKDFTVRIVPPSGPGKKTGWQLIGRKGDPIPGADGWAENENNAKKDAESYLVKRGTSNATATASATVDFNVEFSTEIIGNNEPFWANVDYDNGTPKLYVSTTPQAGLKRTHLGRSNPNSNTQLQTMSLTAKELNAAKLVQKARYRVEDQIGEHGDDLRIFTLTLDSETQGSNDKQRLRVPAITVAG
jgi:hypothetical protein